ncbi:activating transcription factor of chaperone isoform X2 [Cardiocondyla obscurior]|uniref:activating transcription factor of chaperone isoform X2 n=1 Tax=Cardiocondyla obscurior TaxID=286306 RepID=UPI0039657436
MAALCYSEPFSDWLEEKIVDIPLFDNVSFFESNPTKSPLGYPIIAKTSLQQEQPQQQHDNTQTLLQEFETVLGDVEACHQIIPPTSSTLTPPQSPPHKAINVDTQLLVTLQPVQPFADNQPIYNIASAENSLYVGSTPRQWTAENISLNAFGGDVANELAVVDEYVRSHTKNVSSPSSPCSSGSSCISADDSTDDPDWSVETERRSLKLKQDVHDSSKYRHKPYSRSSLEDKKVRKKEQNKNAATRYRQKKKQEIKEILGEERELAEHNEQLKEKMKSLQQEIGYLKGFMRDVFKAKGFLK